MCMGPARSKKAWRCTRMWATMVQHQMGNSTSMRAFTSIIRAPHLASPAVVSTLDV
jgi:hypothetical protein